MRHNTPIVDREYPVPAGQALVSTTDLQGRITHCNAAFVAVSGYALDELLGQPHNLIRHPDMPEEAFRDLWQTIAAGKPWSAPVKNRRKDGSYYWVLANVTPVLDGDTPAGYMSVRTQVSREAIEQAQQLYARLRDASSGTRLQGGRVIASGWQRWRAAIARPTPGAQLGLTALALAAVCFAAGWLAAGPRALPGALLLAAAVAAAVWRLRRIALRPLHELLAFCNRMAAGDLRQRLDAGDAGAAGQVAGAMNQLNVNLMSVVGDARTESQGLLAGTAEIAAGNGELSRRTESQAASLQQTAASMEQITSTVKQSSDAAERAAELADQASLATRAGSDAVAALLGTIGRMQAASQRIAEIVAVIDGIAFQTNILSLNAAVEAARAGEHGKGFAIVAAEVRALAHRSATAAREVKTLIDDSGRVVATGTQQAQATRATMDEALRSALQLTGLIHGISHGAREQLTGISQINEAVGQLDAITQQNAALVEQIAASSLGLQQRAQALTASVSVFTLDPAGARDPAPDAPALRRAAKQRRKAA